ncbi:hypothetical protein PUN28_015345 [Cardiocondyla obscurior]|uniref:Uncharacterized protein n=1 Tax=Cardiocondyla obscurior TaxID=286306 RepID=A0AAW2ESI9_9HYME
MEITQHPVRASRFAAHLMRSIRFSVRPDARPQIVSRPDINWDRTGASYKMPNSRNPITISRPTDRLENPSRTDAFLDLFLCCSRNY